MKVRRSLPCRKARAWNSPIRWRSCWKLLADVSAIAKEKNIYVVLPTLDVGKSPAENVVRIIDLMATWF